MEEYVDVDSILATAIDQQAADNAEKETLDEPGWYTSNDGMTINVEKDDDGRVQVRLFGIGTNDLGKTARLNVRLSPDFRAWQDYETKEIPNPDKPDTRHKMYLQARRAYINATGEQPATVKHIVDYLEKYPVRYQIIRMNGRNGRGPSTMVFNIAASK